MDLLRAGGAPRQHAYMLRHIRFVCLLFIASTTGRAQAVREDPAESPGLCWRFSFGEWTPALDWSRAGHWGRADSTAASIRRIRDSVYAKDSVAAKNNAMTWFRNESGAMTLLLYPTWWPAGIQVTFDSTLAGGREMSGTAIALVASGARAPSKARARAWQAGCRPS
jgi:hypothetical protein